MNVFNLFESKNIENIKLGLEVVKTLDCQKEFGNYFKSSFEEYEKKYNIFLDISESDYMEKISHILSSNGLNFKELYKSDIAWILQRFPQFVDILDIHKLDGFYTANIVHSQPELINKLNIMKCSDKDIYYVLTRHPQLKPYFDKQYKTI